MCYAIQYKNKQHEILTYMHVVNNKLETKHKKIMLAHPVSKAENRILFVCPLPTYPHFTPLPKKLYCNFV